MEEVGLFGFMSFRAGYEENKSRYERISIRKFVSSSHIHVWWL